MDKDQYVADIQPATRLVADSVARRRFNTLLTRLFAIVALVLASMGIFGVVRLHSRPTDAGDRLARGFLGTQTRDVLRLDP